MNPPRPASSIGPASSDCFGIVARPEGLILGSDLRRNPTAVLRSDRVEAMTPNAS